MQKLSDEELVLNYCISCMGFNSDNEDEVKRNMLFQTALLSRLERGRKAIIKPYRKDGWEYTCDNNACFSAGQYIFEQGDAIWISCGQCLPPGVEIIKKITWESAGA